PIATPCRRHSAMAVAMVCPSPAWPPQARLAELTCGAIAASWPPPSPRSQLKSIRSVTAHAPGVDRQRDSMQPLLLALQRLSGLPAGAGGEAQPVAGAQLGQQRPVRTDHVADARIAAVGLGIG